MTIPINIGVTGHRNLRGQDIPVLKGLVTAELQKLRMKYPDTPLVMLNSLAAGADTLCAEAAIESKISLVCPLPFPVEEYRKDFLEVAAEKFDALVKKADDIFVAQAAESVPADPTRDFYYRQAGIYITQHSHILLALWDGSPAKPDGCGTAETVGFMLKAGNVSCESGPLFASAGDGAVIHIHVPKDEQSENEPVRVTLLENEEGTLSETLQMTDCFNRDVKRFPAGGEANLVGEDVLEQTGGRAKHLHTLYGKADKLSSAYRDQYLSVMRWLSIFGVGLVLSFLLYDEFESNLFLPLYGMQIAASAALLIWAGRGNFHRKYLQYRMLSEVLRVQFFLTASGIRENVCQYFTWTQKREISWIRKAATALLTGLSTAPCLDSQMIEKVWINDQLAYHKKALARDSRKEHISSNTAKAMLIVSFAIYVMVFILEFFFGSMMTAIIPMDAISGLLMMHGGQELIFRGVFKILLGVASAITLFLTNYYGKLSFNRKTSDHRKMIALYREAKKVYEGGKVPQSSVLLELAREEIIENGNWFSYCLDNVPTINL